MKKLLLLSTLLIALSAQAERVFVTGSPHPQTGQVKTWSYETNNIVKLGDIFSVMVTLDGESVGDWRVAGCESYSHGRHWIHLQNSGASSTREWYVNGTTVGSNISIGICAYGVLIKK